MSTLFSKKCEYAIQSILLLSTYSNEIVVPRTEISKRINIPKEFAAKILKELVEASIITSYKGKSGGFKLAKKLDEINILDIIYLIDGKNLFSNCVMGFDNCNTTNPCPAHREWAKLRTNIQSMFQGQTLDKIMNAANKKILGLQSN